MRRYMRTPRRTWQPRSAKPHRGPSGVATGVSAPSPARASSPGSVRRASRTRSTRRPGGALPADPRPAALMLAPETPYPLAGGGALRTASLLHYLAQRYEVDLVVFRQPGSDDPGKALPPNLVRRLVAIDLRPNSRSRPARVVRNALRL